MKALLLSLVLFCSIVASAQHLFYKSGGAIFDANNERIRPGKVRSILANKPELLAQYNEGKAKKTIGNILLLVGYGLAAKDLYTCATTDVLYPTALTYLGAAAVVIAIPIKAGYSKKIKRMTETYNQELDENTAADNGIEQMSLISNQNGIGVRITF